MSELESSLWSLLWNREHSGRNRSRGEGVKEVKFSQDKCEVSLLGLGLFQNFRAERVKTIGHFKKIIQKHSWNWMKQKSSQNVLAQPVTGMACHWFLLFGDSEMSLQHHAPLFPLQQSRCRQGPWKHPSNHSDTETPASSLCCCSQPRWADQPLSSGLGPSLGWGRFIVRWWNALEDTCEAPRPTHQQCQFSGQWVLVNPRAIVQMEEARGKGIWFASGQRWSEL